ncbi:hypothetical protein GGF40_000137 [Coemansia sp. RSA 1286]|nr:hypothetical protein GGF40_000137 [Coemansia sp. RSA 1286]
MVDVSSLFFQDMLVNESEDFIRELVFPNVHTLELQIASTIGYDLSDIVENEEYKYADEETLEKKYKDNVSKFVLYAKNMLPNVRFFNLIMGGIAHTYSDEFPDIVDLVFEQFSGVRSPSLTVNSKIYNYDVNTPLGSLSIVWKEFSDGPKELVARHADTLQHLKVVLLSSNSGFSEFSMWTQSMFRFLVFANY